MIIKVCSFQGGRLLKNFNRLNTHTEQRKTKSQMIEYTGIVLGVILLSVALKLAQSVSKICKEETENFKVYRRGRAERFVANQ